MKWGTEGEGDFANSEFWKFSVTERQKFFAEMAERTRNHLGDIWKLLQFSSEIRGQKIFSEGVPPDSAVMKHMPKELTETFSS